MADFYAPQFQPPPNFLQQYVQGAIAQPTIQSAQQEAQLGGLKLDQMRIAMQNQRMYQQIAQGMVNRDLGNGAQSNAGTPTGGIQNGPQSSVQQGSDGGIMGFQPSTLGALAILRGDDPLKTAEGVQNYQIKQRQMQVQGPMALAETVSSSDRADQIIRNNPSLQQQWVQIAPQLGLDPFRDLTPENARKAAIFGYNQLAGSAGLPPKAMPGSMETIEGPLGSIYQKDLSGKLTQVKGEEPLKDVIGPNGMPTNVRASRAEGMQPYNASIFGAANLSDQAKELAYQTFAATGKIPSNYGRNPAMQASLMDFIAKRAAADGNTAASIAAKGQQFAATQGVVKDFESGQTSKVLNGLNTAIKHMDALNPLIDAMNNGDVTAINKAANFFKQQTGSPAPTNFAAIKEFVAGEVAKTVLPGGGDAHERQALAAPLNAANSPAQLAQAVAQFKMALAGKTDALRNQWDVGTGGAHGSFDKFLLPETKKALGIESAPQGKAPQQALDYLKAHPEAAEAFKAKYGYLPNG